MQGAVVIITGNVDKEVIKPMIEKYLGSLPVARKANTYVDYNMEVVPGKVEEIFGFDMSTPKTSVLIDYSGDVKYNLENAILMSSVKNLLNLIYTETIREQEGASYGVGISTNVSYLPKQKGELLLQFDTDPEKSERIIQMAIDGIENLAKNGPTPEQLNKIKENLLKQVPESRISNSYWSNCISTYYKVGVDLDAQKEAVINSITAEKIQKFATDLLTQGNRVKIVMNPNLK
jgi:zinc protease